MPITTAGIARVLEVLKSDMTHISIENLNIEVARKQISLSFIDGDTLIEEIYFSESEIVGQDIDTINLIANGTDTPGTGSIIVKDEALKTKTGDESLTISVEITVKEVF